MSITIKLPEREWFTHQQLALRWGTEVDYINHLVETGKLDIMPAHPFYYDCDHANPINVFMLAEVTRFEKEFGGLSKSDDLNTEAEKAPIFDAKAYINNRLLENQPIHILVHDLRTKGLTNLEVGELLDLGKAGSRNERNALKTKVQRLYDKGLKIVTALRPSVTP